MRIAAPLFGLTISLVIGIVAGYFHQLSEVVTLLLLTAAVIAVMPLRHFPRLQTAMLWFCFALLGLHLAGEQRRSMEVSWKKGMAVRRMVVASEPVDKGKTIVLDALTAQGKKIRCRMLKDSATLLLKPCDGLLVRSEIKRIGFFRPYFDSHGYAGHTFVYRDNWMRQRVSLAQLSYLQRARLQLLLWRHQLLRHYRSSRFSDEQYAVLAAMTLGDKSALTQEIRDTYAITGASHVLALSGLHLGIIYMLLSLVTLGRRFYAFCQIFTILCIWLYALLTGLSPSITRSATMLSIFALLSIGYRSRMSVNVLSFTAMVMLIIHPYAVLDVGFQMSFMAVLAILVFNPIVSGVIPVHMQQRCPILSWCWQLTTVSLSAQMGVAPLIAYYFHRFSTYFLLANFIAIPTTTFILYGALLLLITSSPMVATLLGAIISTTIQALTAVASLPHACTDRLYPNALQVVLCYLILACIYALAVLRHPHGWRHQK